MSEHIQFISEEVDFELTQADELENWITQIIAEHNFILQNLTYIFCSDDYLHEINLTYLHHDTLTDIITFNNADDEQTIEGDIFISIDRVRDNASQLNLSFEEELHRVLIHGVLHLLGYDDKDTLAENEMRAKEDYCLSLRKF